MSKYLEEFPDTGEDDKPYDRDRPTGTWADNEDLRDEYLEEGFYEGGE